MEFGFPVGCPLTPQKSKKQHEAPKRDTAARARSGFGFFRGPDSLELRGALGAAAPAAARAHAGGSFRKLLGSGGKPNSLPEVLDFFRFLERAF